MDQSQRTVATTPSSSRSYQFHPARAAIIDLFNLYLGVNLVFFSNLRIFFFQFLEFSAADFVLFDREETVKSLMNLYESLRKFL